MSTGMVIFPACQRKAELHPVFGRFGAVVAYPASCLADGDTVPVDRKVILVLHFDAPLFIEFNE